MDESGQRAPYPEVIDEKGLKSKGRVFAETLITLGFWALVIYLLAIFITFILWSFGFHLVYKEIYILGFNEMQRLFTNSAIVTVSVVTVLCLWSWYNIALVKIKGERRKSQVSICFDEDMAKFFKVDPDVLERIKNYPRLFVTIKQDTLIFREPNLPVSQDK